MYLAPLLRLAAARLRRVVTAITMATQAITPAVNTDRLIVITDELTTGDQRGGDIRTLDATDIQGT